MRSSCLFNDVLCSNRWVDVGWIVFNLNLLLACIKLDCLVNKLKHAREWFILLQMASTYNFVDHLQIFLTDHIALKVIKKLTRSFISLVSVSGIVYLLSACEIRRALVLEPNLFLQFDFCFGWCIFLWLSLLSLRLFFTCNLNLFILVLSWTYSSSSASQESSLQEYYE